MLVLVAMFSAGFIFSKLTYRTDPKRYNFKIVDNIFEIWAGFWICLLVANIIGGSILLHRLAAICLGILAHQATVKSLKKSRRTLLVRSNASGCQHIIQAKKIPTSEEKNQLSDLEARAGPNRRLKEFFGVENCFTSTDPTSCKEFRTKVEKLLEVEESKWKDWKTAVITVAHRELGTDFKDVPIISFVQMVTLKTMLQVLFKMNPENTEKDAHIRKLAHEINVQWLRSKVDPSTKIDRAWSKSGNALHDAMKGVFPEWNVEDMRSNPLNLILPGYETLWRAVLRCLIEVTARGHEEDTSWQATLESFACAPSRAQLIETSIVYNDGKSVGSPQPSAMHIAQEALRLYPPTRRVYRDFKDSDGNELQAAADIETLQRNPDSVWGESSSEFRPQRWSTMKDEDRETHYMPFGFKPFRCPAKKEKNVPMPFGVSMIALLVGGILLEIGRNWEIEAELPENGVPLDTDREAYSTAKLVLARKKLE